MNYGSVCSGIESATVAWHPLGWKPVFFAETDKFPSAVLKHHHPDVPNAGDFTAIQDGDYDAIDALVGGTPCQDFSVAGLRVGMDGKRGQLTVEYAHLAHRLRTRWMVWENVPGVLSIDGGEAFATFLGLLCGHTVKVPAGGWQNSGVIVGAPSSYGLAYRVLDAQYCGVPQRRRRVFVVGYLGDWRRAAAVLFERDSLSGNTAPRKESGQVAPTLPSRRTGGGGLGGDFDYDGGLIASTGDISHCLNAGGMGRQDYETETVIVTHALRGEGFDASEDGTGRGTPLVPVAFKASGQEGFTPSEISPPITSTDGGGAGVPTIAFSCKDHGADASDISPTLRSMGHDGSHANAGGQVAVMRSNMAVRRLTPRECERLQGFPDGYTKISEKTADGPRYKALGNSMAVPVMRWIAERIQMVDSLEVA